MSDIQKAVIRYSDQFGFIEDVLIFGLSEDKDTTQRYVKILDDAIKTKKRLDVDFIIQKMDLEVPDDVVI